MRFKPASVRTRFTVWYTAALLVILFLFSTGTYFFVRASLIGQTDGQLRQHAATLERVLSENPVEVVELMEYGSIPLFRVMDGDIRFAVTNAWLDRGLDKGVSGGETGYPRSWIASNGNTYRLHAAVLSRPGHTYRIAVAVDEEPALRLLRPLAFILLLGIPLAIVLALAGGYLLAGRVLAPVSAITAKAREITAELLSERLPVDNPEDEFGQLAAVFNETFARLEDSFERMRRFTADASHELRTPLTAIRSVGEVGLQENNDAAACREVISSMLEEADRLTKLVESLLTLSRADSGAMPFRLEQTDLKALAAEVVDCLQVLAEEKGQELALEAAEPVFAEVDRAILRQALINLVDNAIKYTQEKGRIRVAVSRTARGEAAVEVIDNGPGVPEEHQKMIFNRFYRVDRGRSREMGGAGLGLAIVHWAVEANHGRLELESGEGKGCAFRILLACR